MKIFIRLLLVLLVASTVSAQPITIPTDLSQPVPNDPDVRIGKLKNGMTYYIRKNLKPKDKIEFRLVVNAGSILEDDDQLGLAHFVEHMAFNGSLNFKKNELVNYLQSIGVEFGADLNAYTSFDETVYMLPIPTDNPEHLDKGLLVLKDWASGLTFDEAEIDKERGVVIEEWRRGRGAQQRMRDEWFPQLFKDSRYADRLPIGSEDIIQNASYETIKRFYKDWYRPDLMAIVAVGDIEPDELEKKLRATFKKVNAPQGPLRDRLVANVPDHDETLVIVTKDKEAPITQVQLLYKHDKESNNTLQDLRQGFVHSLYNSMIRQRLDELRRSANPPFIGAGSGYSNMVKTKAVFASTAAVGEEQVISGIIALATENERVRRHGFTQGELDRAKKNMLDGMDRSLKEKDKTESNKYLNRYIQNFLNESSIPSTDFRVAFGKATIPSITLEEVSLLAQKWVRDQNRVIIITAPDKVGLSLPSNEEVLAALVRLKDSDILPYSDALAASELMEMTPEKGSIVSEKSNELFGSKEWILSNGARVCWKTTDFKNDQILFKAFSYGGTSLYSDEDYFSAINAGTSVSQGGVGVFSPIDLQKLLSGKNVNINAYVSDLDEGLDGSASPKDLETLFQLINLHFTDPRKDGNAFNSYVNRIRMTLPNLLSDPRYYYHDVVSKIMSQDHLRGGGIPTLEELDKVNFNRAFEIYVERFANAADFNFYFVGNIDESVLRDYVETYLASLPALEEKENFEDSGVRPPSALEKVFYKGQDPKATVDIKYRGEATFDFDEDYKIGALGKVVSNRLIEKIREEKSGVYSIRASGDLRLNPYENYAFNISFPCAPDNVDELLAAVMSEIKDIKANGPTEAELNKVTSAELQNRKENLKKNNYWINQMRSFDYLQAKTSDYAKQEDRIKNLTTGDIQQMANKYLKQENLIQLILLPESSEANGG